MVEFWLKRRSCILHGNQITVLKKETQYRSSDRKIEWALNQILRAPAILTTFVVQKAPAPVGTFGAKFSVTDTRLNPSDRRCAYVFKESCLSKGQVLLPIRRNKWLK